jgi:DNA-binding beta-propeller fold protein YncE
MKLTTLSIFSLLMAANNLVFAQSPQTSLHSTAVFMPNAEEGVGFDDLGFSNALHKVIVPGGQTGRIFLIDPDTKEITIIEGLKAEEKYKGGHGEGVTSADEGSGFLFAIDRSAMLVEVIDPIKKQILSSTILSHNPDYVRYVKETNEVWVTQPGNERIEVFTFSKNPKPMLTQSRFIEVTGGPESLIIDQANHRAYTHLWRGQTVEIDIKAHSIVSHWPNGCVGSRGIALDEKRGFLFAGCGEGKAVVLNLKNNGKQLASLTTGEGVDVIGYNPALSHLYLSGAKSATLSVIAVSDQGQLSLLGEGDAVAGAHCATGDDQGNVWVCDPQHGRLLLYKDSF